MRKVLQQMERWAAQPGPEVAWPVKPDLALELVPDSGRHLPPTLDPAVSGPLDPATISITIKLVYYIQLQKKFWIRWSVGFTCVDPKMLQGNIGPGQSGSWKMLHLCGIMLLDNPGRVNLPNSIDVGRRGLQHFVCSAVEPEREQGL